MEKPLVSCLCITYNRPKLLKEMLYCFLAQDYENKELIIVNDQINLVYNCNQPFVTVRNINSRFNSVGEKRNYTKKLASKESKYIYWFDDDEIYYPDFLSHMVKQHETYSEYDIVRPHKTHFSTNNNISNYSNTNVGFPTASFTKKYSDNKDFEPLMFGSDQRYFNGAKIHRLSDEKVTSHIRWGLNIYHVSGLSGDIDNPEVQKIVYDAIDERGQKKNKEIIELIPELSDEVKKYYKIY